MADVSLGLSVELCEHAADPSHGGTAVSYYVRDNLANIVESVTPADIPAAVDATEELGGYFRRWRGGALQRWTKWASGTPAEAGKDRLTLDERLTLAFLKVSSASLVSTGWRLTSGRPADQG